MPSFLLMVPEDEHDQMLETLEPWDKFAGQNLVFLTNQHLAELLSILETANPYLKYDYHLEELALCSDEEIDEPSVYQFSHEQQELLAEISNAERDKIIEFAEYLQETEGFQEHPVTLVEDFLDKIGSCASVSLKKNKALYLWIDHDH